MLKGRTLTARNLSLTCKQCIFALLGALACFCDRGSLFANEQSDLLSLLEQHDYVVEFIDSKESAEREYYVRDLSNIIRDARGETLIDAVAAACAIKPWTLGDDQADSDFQSLLWSLAVGEVNSRSELFGLADCAGANRKNFYFDIAVLVPKQLEDALCADRAREWLTDKTIAYWERSLENINKRILEGMPLSGPGSYFPIRNAGREAMVGAYKGVAHFQSSIEKGKALLVEAGEKLTRWADPKVWSDSRNGWRFRSDYALLGTIYKAIGGAEGAREELANFEQWPSVRADLIYQGAMEPGLFSEVPENYIDPIYVKRLLPGAGSSNEEECRRWQSSWYDTRLYAQHANRCLTSVGEIGSVEDLRTLDNCMAELVVADWHIRFDVTGQWEKEDQLDSLRLNKAWDEIAAHLGLLGEVGKKVAANVTVEIIDDRLYVQTPAMFKSDEIAELKGKIVPGYHGVEYRRPELF